MVKIAICDDEEKSVALHERMVRECLQAAGIGCEITTYTQSRNLLYDITDDAFFYDLILLDIEMPGISGMELPQQIKGFLPNVRIIFVTSHTEYAIDAFELSIFRYVPKNNLGAKLPAAVLDAVTGRYSRTLSRAVSYAVLFWLVFLVGKLVQKRVEGGLVPPPPLRGARRLIPPALGLLAGLLWIFSLAVLLEWLVPVMGRDSVVFSEDMLKSASFYQILNQFNLFIRL